MDRIERAKGRIASLTARRKGEMDPYELYKAQNERTAKNERPTSVFAPKRKGKEGRGGTH